MKFEELNLIAQLIDSMEQASKELDNSLKNNNVEGFKKYKEELLKFQKQVETIIG